MKSEVCLRCGMPLTHADKARRNPRLFAPWCYCGRCAAKLPESEPIVESRRPFKNGSSPWGRIEDVRDLGPGVVWVSTASHGGAWVSEDALPAIPAAIRAYAAQWSHGWGEQWYEEDVACIGALAFVPGVPERTRLEAERCLPNLRRFVTF